jgi:hypothetical protein
MAQITLSDYVGFIFSEIVKARVIADAESKRIALIYKDDEILKSFSVPRFKIPEMDITIPVLLSGAKYKTILVFNTEQVRFADFVKTKLNNAKQSILIARANLARDFTKFDSGILSAPVFIADAKLLLSSGKLIKGAASKKQAAGKTAAVVETATLDSVIAEFYDLLVKNPDPSAPENIVSVKWSQLFNMMITQNNLMADYNRLYPNGELFVQTSKNVLDFVKQNTVVSKTQIENILINPETQTVKEGSTDTSVFTLKARIVEDGVFIKEIMDDKGNVTERIVEFD